MRGVGHEDYYPRLCDCSRRRCGDRFWALGALHSDQGKGRSEALHTDDPNNSCWSCPDWPCAGLTPVARVGGLPVNDLRLAMPLYWLVYRHYSQICVVIEPGAERGWPVIARLCRNELPKRIRRGRGRAALVHRCRRISPLTHN